MPIPQKDDLVDEALSDRAPRRRMFKGVKIGFKNSHCVVNGVIKNYSDTGALLELEDSFVVPDQLTMFNELEGYKVDCEVVHRIANRIGVKFVGVKETIKQTRYQVINPIT